MIGGMELQTLDTFLEQPDQSQEWLRAFGVQDTEGALANLKRMMEAGITLDLLADICGQLGECLPAASDPDRVLNCLERFVSQSRNPLSLGGLFERDRDALPTLIQMFSVSQHLSDLLIRDPETYDLLRLTEGQPVAREVLVNEICAEVDSAADEPAIMRLLRRYKHRETLRIAYGDIIRKLRLEVVTRQISFLADSVCEGALRAAHSKLEAKHGAPRRDDGQRARFVVLGMGKLGGTELNYSSDIDLIFLSDGGGRTDGPRSISNDEYFDRLARQTVKLLTDTSELGAAYRVDVRLRPHGSQGKFVESVDGALHYYDVSGRTWERQAFVKARAVAGDLDLGHEFLERLRPWIYRRYLARADITGIKALKRRIEQRARREGGDYRNVKTGLGGIRDVEFVIQFLQLLNGSDLPQTQGGNTLEAIAALESAGCLTMQERSILEDNYQFLRKLEHRLQIMYDLQTHTLPEDQLELSRLSIRLGYRDANGQTSLEQFQADYQDKTTLNRQILDHLLHQAFGDEGEIEPEVDLVLDPDPSEESIERILSQYQFRDVPGAYRNLMTLATERIPFLSTRRCRHFLASIAPKLLRSIASTPDPDFTLMNLSGVSDSLGGKGVLWELFSVNQPSMRLYVQLCASSPYLSAILTSNPGMIDELMDSLVLDRLPTLESCQLLLADLCRGAEDIEPMMHNFKNSQHLRVGVRDILDKESIEETHRALSDVAETLLAQATRSEYDRLAKRFGHPTNEDGDRCGMVILAMGKLGGREPNYHSDLDVIFLYEADGQTWHEKRSRNSVETTTNQHFFSQLGQRIISFFTRLGPHGRLYEVDARLRPTGKSGPLAVSLTEFKRYFREGDGALWERQALCKARPVYGSDAAREATMEAVCDAITVAPWTEKNTTDIYKMRHRLQETASRRNLKRGPGGTVDIEFTVQMLQLRHAEQHESVLQPGTLAAINALRAEGCIGQDDAEYLGQSYRFLRSVESRLRLMNTTARHDLPEDEHELRKLAYFLGYEEPQQLIADCEEYTTDNRNRFEQFFAARQE